MIYMLAAALVLGIILSYFLFAFPMRKQLREQQSDLMESHRLLQAAKEDKDAMAQKVADLEYKLGESQKDLAFERGQKGSD